MEISVPFVAVNMPAASPFEIHIRAAMAEEEPRKISERTKAALAAAKRRGVKLGRTVGEVNKRKKKAADAFEKKLLPVISQLRVEALNARNVPPAKGGRWHFLNVQHFLGRLAVLKKWTLY